MLKVKRILFPTDFSETGDAALAHACHWAQKLGAELHLFHVVESLRPDLYASAAGALAEASPLDASLGQHARVELERLRGRAREHGVAVSSAAVEGLSAAPTILDYSEAHDFDLVVMSTHGRRGLRRFLLGSVAEEVVQRSSCPVLTLRGGTAPVEAGTPHRILAAVDLSDHSRQALAHAKELAAVFSAELQLLHVLVRPSIPVYYDGVGAPDAAYYGRLAKGAQSALEELYANAPGPGGPVSIHTAEGVAVEEILRFAQVNSSDLVVIASHGLTGVSHLLLGSVAERVVRQAPCPVLALKSFGKSLLGKDAALAAGVRSTAKR
jgi:nucleotide-binding universal stress UspA family protein